MLSHPLDLPWTAFGKAKRARAVIVDLIRSKIEMHGNCKGGEGSFMDLVLSAGGEGSLGEEEIADNLIGLFAGGHDTTASALATLLKQLALAPHVLQRLRTDCQKLRDDKKEGEPLTWNDISGLHYLRNVISEGLRIVAPINGGFKQAKTDIVYGDYTIPKGWKVHYSTRQTNNKKEYFCNPEKFDPDRFNERHEPFSFIPFGQGNRICPGNEFAKLEMQVFLYHLVLRYDWELVEADERTIMFFIPYPTHGLPLLLKPAPPSSANT
ncbi:hypothetical protein SUGI_0879520 [Cryptomeria japonica]|nr:hypothetical protein SUGI_0879520 [Cryptomeria japonica]